MKKFISSVLLCASACGIQAQTESQQYWITMGQDAMSDLKSVGGKPFFMPSVVSTNSQDVSIAQIDESQLNTLSRAIHKSHHRCGGFIVHDSLQSAMISLQKSVNQSNFGASELAEADTVNRLLPNLAKENIVDTINYLSTNFNNRFYSTSGGEAASNGLKGRWEGIVNGLSWANVSQVNHPNWRQKSVLVTLTGSQYPDEYVVVGGHLDSTIGNTSENSTAPGADDDASGIATLTEVMRVFVSEGVQPKRSVKFYAYAAEEVGLRGSKEIANAHAAAGTKVVGALQLDMTGYNGSTNDITMISDYTSSSQNSYLASLLDTYLPTIKYGYSQCGYACSDHASWTNAGFPASFPFEASMGSSNPRIHTTGDTLANMDSSGQHALNFAKLGLAYVIEMAAATPTKPNVLVNNVPVTNLSAASGADIVYTMDVPAGSKNINFEMSGGTGDADLYVKYGSAPTDSSYDCRPYKNGNNESCTGTSAGGTYHVRVKAYSAFSGVSLKGSYSDGTGGLPVIDETKSNVSVATGGWQHYTRDIQAGYQSLTVTMSGGTGDADLYVRHGAQSTDNNYDCRPYKNGNNESCTLTNPNAGTVHIDVKGYTSAGGLTINWKSAE